MPELPLAREDFESASALATWRPAAPFVTLDLDTSEHHEGDQSLRVRCAEPERRVCGVKRALEAAQFAGERVTVQAYIRGEAAGPGSGLWLRAASPTQGTTLGFGEPRGAPSVWERRTATIEVPPDATELVLGVIAVDGGAVWLDDVEVDAKPGSTSAQRAELLPSLAFIAAATVVLAVAHGRVARRRPSLALAAAVASVGPPLALLAPERWFASFREFVIGIADDKSGTTPAQRVMAACGAVLGGLVIARLARGPALPVVPTRARWIILGAVPLTVSASMNAVRGLGRLGVRTLVLPPSVWSAAFVITLAACSVAVVVHIGKTRATVLRSSFVVGAAAGAAYGFFSALWHCCPALWTMPRSGPAMALNVAGFLVWPFGVLGYGTLVALRAPPRWTLAAGGVILAAVYGWHTPVWAAHCFLGGAFAVFLAQTTGSVLAAGAFLVSAYVVHMTAPFVGWYGAAAAALAMMASAYRALKPSSLVRADGSSSDGECERRSLM